MKMVGGSSTIVLIMLLFVTMNSANILVDAMSCQDVITRMLPCQPFLMGFGQISVPCCQSAQSLSQVANTNLEERTSVCQCLKQAASILGINVARAQQIPQLCHIDVDMGLTNPNIDCNKLNAPTPRSSKVGRLEPATLQSNKPDEIWDLIISPSPAHSPNNI